MAICNFQCTNNILMHEKEHRAFLCTICLDIFFLSFSSSCLCVWMLYKFKGRVWVVKRVQAVVSSILSNLLTKEGNPLVVEPSSSSPIFIVSPEKTWDSLPQHCIFSVGQQEPAQEHGLIPEQAFLWTHQHDVQAETYVCPPSLVDLQNWAAGVRRGER